MKWYHWLVWGLLAVWAIGLGACAAPEVVELRQENAKLRQENAALQKALVAVQDKNVALRQEKTVLQKAKVAVEAKWLKHGLAGDVADIHVSGNPAFVVVVVAKPKWEASARCIGVIFKRHDDSDQRNWWIGEACRRPFSAAQ